MASREGKRDAAMTSKAEKGRKIDMPHLAIKYTPTDCPLPLTRCRS